MKTLFLQMKKLLLLLFTLPVFTLSASAMHPPSGFVVNKGQVKSQELQICFTLQGGALTYYFSDRGYSVVQSNGATRARTDFFFVNGERIFPQGEEILSVTQHYFLAGSSSEASVYKRIVYHLHGMEVLFSVDGDQLRRTVIFHSGMPQTLSLFEENGAVVSGKNNGYVFTTAAGAFEERPGQNDFTATAEAQPLQRSVTPVTYRFSDNGNPSIAAASISWLTYLGGTSADELFAVASLPNGGSVVTGRTNSTDFPVTAGAQQDTMAGSYDVVVTRFDAVGNALWSTYYGGTNFETGYGLLRIDTAIFICGSTNSTDLPVMNAWQPNNNGSYDAFLLQLNDSGLMVRATYFGGTGADQAYAMAEDTSGRIALAGSTTSNNLPLAASGYQATCAGAIDAFLGVFNTQLQPQWSTCYGGSSSEDIHAVTVTPQGEIVFCGGTYSNNFPVTPDAWQSGMLGLPDIYLVKFGMDGTRHYGTFFGGTNTEDANAIVCDSLGRLYMSGFTYSYDFPIQGSSFQTTHAALSDAFVSAFDAAGQLTWSTFVGGNGVETAFGMMRLGKYLFVGGNTESTDFPVSANAIQTTFGGNSDGFVFKMDTAGTMVSGTYMGGNGVDAIYSLTVEPSDTSVIACADTYSTDLPVTPGAYQSSNEGSGDGFVVRFGMSEQLVMSGVEEIAAGSSVMVFPNPAADKVTISSDEEIIRVELFDENGRRVQQYNCNSKTWQLDLHSLDEGVYFLRVASNNGVKVQRIVKQ